MLTGGLSRNSRLAVCTGSWVQLISSNSLFATSPVASARTVRTFMTAAVQAAGTTASFPRPELTWEFASQPDFSQSVESPKFFEPGSLKGYKFQCHFCKNILPNFSFFCPACGNVGPSFSRPAPELSVSKLSVTTAVNPYRIFDCIGNQPMKFEINLKLIQNEFREKMKILHPDHVQAQGGNPMAILLAADHVALISFGWETLRNPITRAVALLKWKFGHSVLTEESMIHDEALMLEILEAKEDAEKANPEELLASHIRWTQEVELLVRRVAEGFKQLDMGCVSPDGVSIISGIQDQLEKVKVINRLLDELTSRRLALVGDATIVQ